MVNPVDVHDGCARRGTASLTVDGDPDMVEMLDV